MALTDIFSTSFLITFSVSLLLVGFLFIYINQKMADQNHKISSMLGLISTMAEELNVCRSRVNMLTNVIGKGSLVNSNGSATLGNSSENLIDVSDGENEKEDEDDDDEEDDDEEDDEEDDDEEDDDDDDEDDDEDYEDSNEDDDDDDEDIVPDEELASGDIEILGDIKSIKFNNNLNMEGQEDESSEEESGGDDEEDNSEDLQELTLEDLDNSEEDDNDVDISNNVQDTNKSPFNLSELKTISINDLASPTDYKKLSLNKLRSIVVEKGITTDASKLNKQKLLKMLEAE
uniref:Rho termination factor N-terminal domain-containing protein n=1 Tax=viral metagenome TaxID=1070528 RepID=A0A6C0F440_9ZZZZ